MEWAVGGGARCLRPHPTPKPLWGHRPGEDQRFCTAAAPGPRAAHTGPLHSSRTLLPRRANQANMPCVPPVHLAWRGQPPQPSAGLRHPWKLSAQPQSRELTTPTESLGPEIQYSCPHVCTICIHRVNQPGRKTLRPKFQRVLKRKLDLRRFARHLHYAVLCLVAQSCPTLCDSMDYSPPGSSPAPGSSRNAGVSFHALF